MHRALLLVLQLDGQHTLHVRQRLPRGVELLEGRASRIAVMDHGDPNSPIQPDQRLPVLDPGAKLTVVSTAVLSVAHVDVVPLVQGVDASDVGRRIERVAPDGHAVDFLVQFLHRPLRRRVRRPRGPLHSPRAKHVTVVRCLPAPLLSCLETRGH